MTGADLATMQRVFEEVVALPASERSSRLAALCPDPQMRERIARMLAADEATDHAIDKPAIDETTLVSVGGGVQAISHIGRYAIERVLGEGGMGVVYLARQQSPERLVAIKVIRSVAPSPDLIKRFEREASVLARLSHPGIAQIFDSGSAPIYSSKPVPYLVLEYVDGTPLLNHVTAERLDESAKLRLFIEICRAVQYAHQRGVIHRDLKPANVLVQRIIEGGAGGTQHVRTQAKILDFGVARTLEDDKTQHTQAGSLIGTLSYMSPEQVGGQTADTRSDVYALGVILYELLCGKLPIDVRDESIANATQKIRETEPARLRSVMHDASGDLDAIAGKCVEKDPARRYQSAGELADDLERYLANLPVLAQPPSTVYQLRKFAARNRVVVTAAAAVSLSVLAFGGLAAWQAVKATRASEVAAAEAARAAAQAERAEAVKNYLVRDLVRAAPPGGETTDGREISITYYFTRALSRLPTAFADKPDLQGEIRAEIGYALAFAGRPTQAVAETGKGLEQLVQSAGDDDMRTIRARVSYADVLQLQGNIDDSRKHAERALAQLEKLPEPPSDLMMRLLTLLAELASNTNRFDECEQYLARVEAMRPGERSEVRLAVLSTRAGALMAQDKWEEARQVLSALMDHGDDYYGADHPQMLAASTNLMVCLVKLKRYDEAMRFAPDTLRRAEETFGPNHPSLAYTLLSVAGVYGNGGDKPQSVAAYKRARDIFVSTFDDYRYEVERSVSGLLRECAGMGDQDGAMTWSDDIIRIRFGVANKDERDGLKKRLELNVQQLARAGVKITSHDLLTRTIERADLMTPPQHPRRARTLANLARAAEDMGKVDLAASLCEKAREALAYSGSRSDDEAVLAQTPCTVANAPDPVP
ncbi:MAG TPA: serine/threonine-protein kinase [Phycisphaerales bacterium]|nr:serine/threonine-protein kinase [Phycisphaerales bacterium]